MSSLSVRNVWKGYAREPVLRGVALEVPAGSLTAVLGLSGCGKTTLLRVIAGFERPDRGELSLDGRTLDDERTYIAPERRSIGYVPQEGALFPHLSVHDNVAFGLRRRERRGGAISGLLEMVGIAPLAKRLPHELSGGEQQRVALARALAGRPHALLLDEPFSSLDASLRSHVREEVQALLREQGVTTVMVTHDQEEALSLADVVAVLRDGLIVQQDTPSELYERPLDERLARFLGAVNVIEARFEDGIARTPLGALELRRAPGSAPEACATRAGVVMIRPEQLDVRSREHRASGSSARVGVHGRVEQCRYYGHDALLHIRPEEPDGIEMLLARVHGEQALAVGTPVSVAAHGPVAPLGQPGGRADRPTSPPRRSAVPVRQPPAPRD
jgi:iron(III) transport system ATP-binding protein